MEDRHHNQRVARCPLKWNFISASHPFSSPLLWLQYSLCFSVFNVFIDNILIAIWYATELEDISPLIQEASSVQTNWRQLFRACVCLLILTQSTHSMSTQNQGTWVAWIIKGFFKQKNAATVPFVLWNGIELQALFVVVPNSLAHYQQCPLLQTVCWRGHVIVFLFQLLSPTVLLPKRGRNDLTWSSDEPKSDRVLATHSLWPACSLPSST